MSIPFHEYVVFLVHSTKSHSLSMLFTIPAILQKGIVIIDVGRILIDVAESVANRSLVCLHALESPANKP